MNSNDQQIPAFLVGAVSGSFLEHTLENCHKAKKLLIETGSFSQNDFKNATQCDVELGYIVGEPLLFSDDNFTSALKLWNEKVFWDTHEDSHVEFMLNCH
jgi:hypothetical protein